MLEQSCSLPKATAMIKTHVTESEILRINLETPPIWTVFRQSKYDQTNQGPLKINTQQLQPGFHCGKCIQL